MADDGYNIGEESDSDDERGWQSDNEEEGLDMFEVQDDSEEDDFEAEMLKELNNSLKRKSLQVASANSKETRKVETSTDKVKKETYDDDYFSSGSDDDNQVGGVPSKSKQRRKVLTNEELFYDPEMDEIDEKWVNKQRENNSMSDKSKKGQNMNTAKCTKAPGSDAMLSCPACLTMLCIDCQRHDIYKNQYRAMFVMNCTVVEDEILRYKEQRHKHRGKRKLVSNGNQQKLVSNDNQQTDEGEVYHPVKCSECQTEVAVYDSDEVYHFFDVLTSYA